MDPSRGAWESNPRLMLALWASCPSGAAEVLAIREKLMDLSFGPGHSSANVFTEFVAPVVAHVLTYDGEMTAESLAVWNGTSASSLSPWSCPYLPEEYSLDVAREYINHRADVRCWLSHLSSRRLVCTCTLEPSQCWAFLLRDAACQIFGDGLPGQHDVTVDPVAKCVMGTGSGVQPRGVGLPQLVPDGLSPAEHIAASAQAQHPMKAAIAPTRTVQYALAHSIDNANETNSRRFEIMMLLVNLADVLQDENDRLLNAVHPNIKRVLTGYGAKNIALMREIGYIAQPADSTAVSSLVLGLPQTGWAPPAWGLMLRHNPPTLQRDEWRARRDVLNRTAIARVRPCDDRLLEYESLHKSMQEVERGVLDGPFMRLSDIPSPSPALVPRAGIWELHGDATEPKVRNIDDMLITEHNATVGTHHSHRPTSVDALAAQTRAVSARFPSDVLHGFPSDYAKAYKQIPADPLEEGEVTIVQWSPIHQRAVLFIPYSQVFGSKAAPLNFSRYPSWCCWCLASLFAIAASHCVDDMIFVERASTAMSAWTAWQLLAALMGWDLDEAKSPFPMPSFNVIGVSLNFPATVADDVWIAVTRRRVDSLTLLLNRILDRGTLGRGEASSITGKLGFTLEASYGRVGRAKLRPLLRRAYDHYTALNPQLMACIRWWLRFLATMAPRRVPTSLVYRETIVTYSDGEGSGGVGIGLFRPGCTPLAAYTSVPECIRLAWQRARDRANSANDIFLIEAIGPLLVLFTWPNLVKNTWWLHFIDNEGSEYSLIRGSSSIQAGDHIVGLTWERVFKLQIIPWFDRVESEANPVDGLSRGRMEGPWTHVQKAVVPTAELLELARECGNGSL